MTDIPIDPNESNGVNPLNTLDFDINTMIPQKDFNWDTVDGIDSINNSIQKAYGNVTADLTKRVDTITGKVASYDCAITDSLGRCIDNVSSNTDNIDAGIVDSLCLATDGLCETYGSGIGEVKWWIIYRQCDDGLYHPFLEPSTSGPIGYEVYGPFADCSPFRIDIAKTMAILPPKETSSPSGSATVDLRVQGLYAEQLAYLQNVLYPGYQEGQGEDGSGMCGPLSDCNWSIKAPIKSCSPQKYGATMPGREGCYEIWYPDTCDEVTEIAKDPDGRPYFRVVNNSKKYYEPWTKKEVCIDSSIPDVGIPNPIITPIQEGGSTAVPPSQQPTIPTNPPSSGVTTPPPSNGSNSSTSVSSCPTPVIQNVVNVAPCQDSGSSGSGQSINVEPTDLNQLIDAIRECCTKLSSKSEVKTDGIASDIEYLYSDSGQDRIDLFLQSNGLDRLEKLLPDTIGQGVSQLLDKINGEY